VKNFQWGFFIFATLLLILVGILIGQYCFSPVAAQQTTVIGNDLDSLHASIGNFFENLSDPNKSIKKTLDDFLKNSPLVNDEKITNDIATKIKDINTTYGSYVAYEPIDVKSVGTDLIVIRYLYKCRNYPVLWYFTYYRPSSKPGDVSSVTWSLIGFRYDSNLDILLQDMTF